jgi:hypothetical protein
MNLYHKINDIDYNKIFFYKPVVNKITHYSYFYKLMYDVQLFTLNSLNIEIDIESHEIIEENKKYRVNIKINDTFLDKIKLLEENIIKSVSYKQNSLSCYKYLTFNKLSYIYDKYPEKINLILRISGLWETNTCIGITTKIIHL